MPRRTMTDDERGGSGGGPGAFPSDVDDLPAGERHLPLDCAVPFQLFARGESLDVIASMLETTVDDIESRLASAVRQISVDSNLPEIVKSVSAFQAGKSGDDPGAMQDAIKRLNLRLKDVYPHSTGRTLLAALDRLEIDILQVLHDSPANDAERMLLLDQAYSGPILSGVLSLSSKRLSQITKGSAFLSTKQRMVAAQLSRIAVEFAVLYPRGRLLSWLESPNQYIGATTPRQLLFLGQYEEVLGAILAEATGAYA